MSPTKSLHTMNIWLTCEKKKTQKMRILTSKIKVNKASIVTQVNKPSSCHIQAFINSLSYPSKYHFINGTSSTLNINIYIMPSPSLIVIIHKCIMNKKGLKTCWPIKDLIKEIQKFFVNHRYSQPKVSCTYIIIFFK